MEPKKIYELENSLNSFEGGNVVTY